jgi:hypothetical protein
LDRKKTRDIRRKVGLSVHRKVALARKKKPRKVHKKVGQDGKDGKETGKVWLAGKET